MEARFKIGDTVYVFSRYDGIVLRTIQSIVSYDDSSSDQEDWTWTYELNKPVQIRKDGESIGVKTRHSDEFDLFHYPAPEYALMLIGDNIFSTHWLFGGITDEILTMDKINNESE